MRDLYSDLSLMASGLEGHKCQILQATPGKSLNFCTISSLPKYINTGEFHVRAIGFGVFYTEEAALFLDLAEARIIQSNLIYFDSSKQIKLCLLRKSNEPVVYY